METEVDCELTALVGSHLKAILKGAFLPCATLSRADARHHGLRVYIKTGMLSNVRPKAARLSLLRRGLTFLFTPQDSKVAFVDILSSLRSWR